MARRTSLGNTTGAFDRAHDNDVHMVVVAIVTLASQGVFAGATPAEVAGSDSPGTIDVAPPSLATECKEPHRRRCRSPTLALGGMTTRRSAVRGASGQAHRRHASQGRRLIPTRHPDPNPDPTRTPILIPNPDAGPGAAAHPERARFDIRLSATLGGQSTEFWAAPYFRSLPYTSQFDVGWIDGDRVGYRCAYMFLESDGAIVGRVTFTRPSEASTYTTINDRFMNEGARYYNGAIDLPAAAQLNDCPYPSQQYGAPAGPDERPLIYYSEAGELIENRSYTNTNGEAIANGDLVFQELERISTPFTDVGQLGINPHTVYETGHRRRLRASRVGSGSSPLSSTTTRSQRVSILRASRPAQRHRDDRRSDSSAARTPSGDASTPSSAERLGRRGAPEQCRSVLRRWLRIGAPPGRIVIRHDRPGARIPPDRGSSRRGRLRSP